MTRNMLSPWVAVLLWGCSSPAAAGADRSGDGAERHGNGPVQLQITCQPEVNGDFQEALTLLHSFFYEEARRRFLEIAERDPQCAMAWWGVAMTYYHPLWQSPTPAEMAAGVEASAEAQALGAGTDLERGLIAAIDAYFRSSDQLEETAGVAQSCHGPRAHGARALAFRGQLEELQERHPDDLEVTVFRTLALLGTAPPTDLTYANQLEAAAILEPLFEQHPEHPGIAHYIIHAYDYPTLASRGLAAARHYGSLAPDVPHALHMPSHIYTRLGMWQDSIAANLASAAAARDHTARYYGGAVWYDELHALDYLVFAYLQVAQDAKAVEVLEYLRGVQHFQEPNFAAAYAIGAIPARMALERRRWDEAAALPVLHPAVVSPYPFALALTEFARAVGSARGGDVAGAGQALARLAELGQALTDPKFQWWIDQVEIQRLAAAGWLARAEGRPEAEALLRAAVALENEAGTHPVTPGQILPASEQLGDLLMELDRPLEALAEYERSLAAFPHRFNSHAGAARAAERAGKPDVARVHYAEIVAMAGDGDGLRDELDRARAFLGGR